MAVYDDFAWFYRRYWCAEYQEWAEDVLARLVFSRLPRGARVLDLCCGAGTLTAAIERRGFPVTGVDISERLLRFARAECQGEFVCADARRFCRPGAFDLAVSTFDSMNHMLEPHDLAAVFANVHASLAGGGLFAFDLLDEEAFRINWNDTAATVEPDHAIIVRGSYDSQRRLGRTDITTFRHAGEWLRDDASVFERCYSREEGRALLAEAGFLDIENHSEPGRWARGRTWFVASKALSAK